MDYHEEWEKLKQKYQSTGIPENGVEGLKKAIERAEKEKAAGKRAPVFKKAGICAAAALVIAVLIPNVSVKTAMAMEKIPVLGGIIRVITFGRYDFEDERHEAKVEIPKVEIELSPEEQPDTKKSDTKTAGKETAVKKTVDAMNKDIEDYIGLLVEEFKSGLDEDAVKTLDISYETVTDSDTWFTLRIDVLEIQASGYMYSRYYHIDKETGESVQLKDLFKEDADYISAISENIREQMRRQTASDEGKIYFIDSEDMPEDNFERIKEDQNFYFDGNGEIVIAFDEYEVAPGYMGPVRFTIPRAVTDGLLKRQRTP